MMLFVIGYILQIMITLRDELINMIKGFSEYNTEKWKAKTEYHRTYYNKSNEDNNYNQLNKENED